MTEPKRAFRRTLELHSVRVLRGKQSINHLSARKIKVILVSKRVKSTFVR